jgi:hypothetical protein
MGEHHCLTWLFALTFIAFGAVDLEHVPRVVKSGGRRLG